MTHFATSRIAAPPRIRKRSSKSVFFDRIRRFSQTPAMPRPGMLWRHCIINTRCSWLHGSPKGFRARNHEIHSSGDYRNPPPKGEHEGLYRYYQNIARPPVKIPRVQRILIGRALIVFFRERGFRLYAVAVSDSHAHFVVELPWELRKVKLIVGEAKRISSRAVKDRLPGSVWSAGGTFKPVREPSHLRSAYDYTLFKQGNDAWTWSFRDASDSGTFKRNRARRAKQAQNL